MKCYNRETKNANQEWEKIFALYMSDKEITARLYYKKQNFH